MDWFDGPFVGLEPGPYGEGAKLLDALMTHYTSPAFIYVHEWTQGDVLVWDNRCLMHQATPWDMTQPRVMWHSRIAGDPVSEAALAA